MSESFFEPYLFNEPFDPIHRTAMNESQMGPFVSQVHLIVSLIHSQRLPAYLMGTLSMNTSLHFGLFIT